MGNNSHYSDYSFVRKLFEAMPTADLEKLADTYKECLRSYKPCELASKAYNSGLLMCIEILESRKKEVKDESTAP